MSFLAHLSRSEQERIFEAERDARINSYVARRCPSRPCVFERGHDGCHMTQSGESFSSTDASAVAA